MAPMDEEAAHTPSATRKQGASRKWVLAIKPQGIPQGLTSSRGAQLLKILQLSQNS